MASSRVVFDLVGKDNASRTFTQVALSARLLKGTFDDLGESTLGLSKLVGGSALVPAAAAATAAIANLGTSMAAGGAAGGIFAAAVIGNVVQMKKQQTVLTASEKKLQALTKGTADYRTQLAIVHTQQQTFNKDFGPAAKGFNDLTVAWSKFLGGTRTVTTSVMGKSMELLVSILPRLVPIANAAGRAVGGLVDELTTWTKGPSFQRLLDWFGKSGPRAITTFGHVAANILSGVGGIFANFIGPGDRAAKTLERLTKRFAVWGNSKGVSDSVQKFLSYTNNNGDKITSVLASLADIAPKLATALGNLGSANLSAISMFLNLLAGMNQTTFNIVVDGLFGIAAGAKAVSIATGVMSIVTGLSGAITVLGDACIATRAGLILLAAQEIIAAGATAIMTGAQIALDAAMDANPIGLVVLAIAALIGGLVLAWKHSETFRKIVTNAFHAVSNAAQAVFGWIKNHWQAIFGILGGPVIAAVRVIVSHFGDIKGKVADVVRAVRGAFVTAFDFAKRQIKAALAPIITTVEAIITKIKWILDHIPKIHMPSMPSLGGNGNFDDIMKWAQGGAQGPPPGPNDPGAKTVDMVGSSSTMRSGGTTTFVINAPLNTKAEVGAAIKQAINAHSRLTGSSVLV